MTGGTMDPETPIVDLEISTRAWNVCRELRLRTEWNELVDKIRMEVSEIGTRKL